MCPPLHDFFADERGGTAIEYGIITSLIFLVFIVAFTLVANRTTLMWNSIANHLT